MSTDNQTTTLGRHIGRVPGDNRPIYRPICRPTYLGRYIGRVLVDMSTDISVECWLIYRSIHQPTVGRYVDRYIGRGVHKIHLIRIVFKFWSTSTCSVINSVLIYAKADKDSTEDGKTEQPAEKQKKEGPSSSEKVDKMCKFIYSRDTSDRIRTRAMLCHVYHHALHDRWFEARDLMLMSHLQESIQHSDIPTQVCVIKFRLIMLWLIFNNFLILVWWLSVDVCFKWAVKMEEPLQVTLSIATFTW